MQYTMVTAATNIMPPLMIIAQSMTRGNVKDASLSSSAMCAGLKSAGMLLQWKYKHYPPHRLLVKEQR